MADIFSEDFLENDPDRRKNERIAFDRTLEIRSEELGKSDFVIGDNISFGGVKFICGPNLIEEILSEEAHQWLQETGYLTEGGPVTIILTAELHLNSEIRWISPANPDTGEWDIEKNRPIPKEKMEGYQICVEFVEYSEQQKSDLLAYIHQLPEDDSLEF